MQNKKKSMLLWFTVAIVMSAGLIFPGLSGAGDLDPPPEAAGEPQSTMFTLEEIYGKLEEMHADIDPGPCEGAPVARTGQKTSYLAGDDGDLEKGVPLPISRFTDNGDGTVIDNLTGLIWLKNAGCFDRRNWSTALSDSNTLNSGECGLSDGSVEGDWRLPSIKELQSLIDFGRFAPALPDGHPFSNMQSTQELSHYWSSTTDEYANDHAWDMYMHRGSVNDVPKTKTKYVWPVRGGE